MKEEEEDNIMAIKDRPDAKPRNNDVADIKIEIAIARYEALRKPTMGRPYKPPKR
jgi:hypothetical protein